MTRIGLEGMEFHSLHGYYEAERRMGSRFLLDVYVTLKTELKASENIDDTVNYERIYKVCKEEMGESRELLETVAFNIVDRLKSEYMIIEKVQVKLRKKGVQVGGKVANSVIEYTN